MGVIKFLGSAAAEGVPGRFCGCETCQIARARGGRDIRRTTSYALNERVRIDYGPDSFSGELLCKLDPSKLQHLFITHAHQDHLDCYPFLMRTKGMSNSFSDPLYIYGMPTVWNDILNRTGRESAAVKTLSYVKLEHFREIELPDENMSFYPLPANHYHIAGEAVFYLIRHGKAWLLIAHDTGFPSEEVWNFLEEKKICLNIVIMDCTFACKDNYRGHMGGEAIMDFCKKLQEINVVDQSTALVVNHFSHNVRPLQDELEKFFNPHGIIVGYDGMELSYQE